MCKESQTLIQLVTASNHMGLSVYTYLTSCVFRRLPNRGRRLFLLIFFNLLLNYAENSISFASFSYKGFFLSYNRLVEYAMYSKIILRKGILL